MTEMKGKLPADHGGELHHPAVVIAHDSGQGHHRNADGAEGYRRGIGYQADTGGIERAETKPHQGGAGDGDRGAEACRTLDEGTEAEGNQQCLDAAIASHSGKGGPDDLKLPTFDGDVVEKQGRDDDVEDGKETKGSSLHEGKAGQLGRHPPTAMAMPMAEATARGPALCAFIFKTARQTKMMTSGMTATSADKPRLPATGVYVWIQGITFSP